MSDEMVKRLREALNETLTFIEEHCSEGFLAPIEEYEEIQAIRREFF